MTEETSYTPEPTVSDEGLGREAARILYDHWSLDMNLDRQYEPGFARGFIDEYKVIQDERRDSVDRHSSKKGGRSAAQLASDPFRGILEVLQNAEDERASQLTVALRRVGKKRELLFIHDGERVGARTVLVMTSAFMSLKEESADTIGKFGIGLKTLEKLGSYLAVHSPPYHWSIQDGDATRIEPSAPIPGLYDPDAGQTLIVLTLDNGQPTEALVEWFEKTDSRTLLFLDHVRTFIFLRMGRQPLNIRRQLVVDQEDSYELEIGRRIAHCKESLMRSNEGLSWKKYQVELPVGKSRRRGKAVGDTVTLSVAVPETETPGKLFAGLPTNEIIGLPFDLGGPFESDMSRERLDTDSSWNGDLLDDARKFVQALATKELKENPRSAWQLIGLKYEVEEASVSSSWLSEKLQGFVDAEQRAIKAAEIQLSDRRIRVRDLAFECQELAGIVTRSDVEALRPCSSCVSRKARDSGRWRLVLNEILDDPEIDPQEALELYDFDIADTKKPAWHIGLAAAAIDSDCGEELFGKQSVLLADGMRVEPQQKGHGCLLVSQDLAETDLINRLSLAKQIHSAYSAKDQRATTVRNFLIEHGAFSDKHSADAILHALSGRTEDPVKLSDEDLLELARLVNEASHDFIDKGLEEVGSAVEVDGYEWVDGVQVYRNVLPGLSYLPAAMEDKDGWAKAAGKTPGITWIHPRYAKLDLFSVSPIKSQRLFRRLGAESAPRISDTVTHLNYGELPAMLETARRLISERTQITPEAILYDKTSSDLLSVAEDIATSKVNTLRRERSRSLIRTLDKAWHRLYENALERKSYYSYRRRWHEIDDMPTQWLAKLAEIKWLSNCEKRSKPLAPQHARIRSDANAAIYGFDQSVYAYEVTDELAENQAVQALGIGGIPRATEHVEALRATRKSSKRVVWTDVAYHYLALSKMCPANPKPRDEIDNTTISLLREEFFRGKLLWCGDWISPMEAFRGEELSDDGAYFVPEEDAYSRLWQALGIAYPNAPDCVRFLSDWAASNRNPADLGLRLQRTYMALDKCIENTSAKVRKDLRSLPLWIGDQWMTERPVYYSESHALADTLVRAGVKMWQVPAPLDSIANILDYLEVERVSPSNFTVDGLTGQHSQLDEELGERFRVAIALLKEFIALTFPQLFNQIPDCAWESLAEAELALVPGLVLTGRVGDARVRSDTQCFINGKEMKFYFESPQQIGIKRIGGDLVAEAFNVDSEARTKISLAWLDSWQRAIDGLGQLYFPKATRSPEYTQGEAVPEGQPSVATVAPGKGKQDAKPKPPKDSQARKLIENIDAITPRQVRKASPTPPEGRLEASQSEVELRPASKKEKGGAAGGKRKRAPEYTQKEKETIGLMLLRKVLALKGLTMTDTRLQPVGADGVASDDYHYEMKVHGGSAGEPLPLQDSEYLQARQLGERYVLVVVENVEATDAVPRITLIPNPLGVLKVQATGKFVVDGYNDDAFEQWELPVSDEEVDPGTG